MKEISIKPVLGLLLGLGLAAHSSAQTESAATACRLSGTDTVVAGSIASFNLSPCSASSWTVSCGNIVSQAPGSVTVSFAGSCGSAVITAIGGAGPGAMKTVTVIAAPAFASGIAAAAVQTISYNTIPASLLVAPATGGLCGGVYTYQWLSSTDNINFSVIAGATGQNYQPGPLNATTYFKRQATCQISGTVTTSAITVNVLPSLSGVPLNPATQAVNYNSPPTTLSLTVPASAAGVRYQWQSASNPAFNGATDISGANGSSYSPDSLASTTYFRAILINNKDSSYSSPAIVTVYPALTAGMLSPASQTVAYDSLPGLLSCTGFSGGNGDFSFQWYSSPDGINWSPVPGVITSGFDPGNLTATTWYQVVVSSNGLMITSSSAVINVTPQQ